MARHGNITLASNTTTKVFTADGNAFGGAAVDGATAKAIRVKNLDSSANNVEVWAAPAMGQPVSSADPMASVNGMVLAPGESQVIWGVVAGSGAPSINQVLARSAGATLNFAVIA